MSEQKSSWADTQSSCRCGQWKMFWGFLMLVQVTLWVEDELRMSMSNFMCGGLGPSLLIRTYQLMEHPTCHFLRSQICSFPWKGQGFVKLSGTFQSPIFRYQGVLEGKGINEQCDKYGEFLFWLGNRRGIWVIYCAIIALCDIDAAVLMTTKCPDWFRWPFTVIITNLNK